MRMKEAGGDAVGSLRTRNANEEENSKDGEEPQLDQAGPESLKNCEAMA